jgi:hypothetical protein
MIKRPSKHECKLKLRQARQCIEAGNTGFADFRKASGEIYEGLGLTDADEVFQLIMELLPEIFPKDYRGVKPPSRSYEEKIKGCDLFPFVWDSKRLGKRMYLKFVIKADMFFYVSLHKDRPH